MQRFVHSEAATKKDYSHKKFTEKDKAEIRAFIMALAMKHGITEAQLYNTYGRECNEANNSASI